MDDGARRSGRYYSWDCVPCCYPDRSGDLRSITKVSDFYSARQWHATGMYRDYIQPAGFDHELMLCLPAGPGRTLRLIFFRGPRPDFAERDRALLTLLRPHLHQAYVEAEHRRGRLPPADPAGTGNCSAWSRPGIPTCRSATGWACRRERCASTWRTSTPGCRSLSRTAAVTRAFPGQHYRTVALGEPAMAVVRDA